jgi:beta-lactamase class D OXA-2
MHLPRIGVALLFLVNPVLSIAASEPATERADWKKHFDDAGAKGTMVVVDERAASRGVFVYDAGRSKVRYSPASTFKVPHALFALHAGAVRDEFQLFQWDGVRRAFSGHNQDQDLRSAMRFSTLWVYQRFAKHIGESQARKYLSAIDYGNADPTTPSGDYWVDGNLRISAEEQVAFLRKLYRNQLPFSIDHLRLVKDLMITEADYEWILRAKTGWEGRYAWWIGWIEWREGPVFFAIVIDTPNRTEDLGKRQTIARAVLRSIHAMPADAGQGAAR